MPQNVYRYQLCPGRWKSLAQARRGSSPWIYCKIALHFPSVRKTNNTSSSHTLACKATFLSQADTIELCSCNSQTKIDHGVLIRWTKGFGALNTEGFDVAEMFRESLAKYVILLSALQSLISAKNICFYRRCL